MKDFKSSALTISRLTDDIDGKIMRSVGESLLAIVRGETNILDILMRENMLGQFYAETLGIKSYLNEMGRIAGQIGNRFPHINVLEIGKGTPQVSENITSLHYIQVPALARRPTLLSGNLAPHLLLIHIQTSWIVGLKVRRINSRNIRLGWLSKSWI